MKPVKLPYTSTKEHTLYLISRHSALTKFKIMPRKIQKNYWSLKRLTGVHNYFPYRLMGIIRGRSFFQKIVNTTHKKRKFLLPTCQFLEFKYFIAWLLLLVAQGALFGDFVTLVLTCYSKALGWEFITKCLRASGSESPGGDPVVLERSHVFYHPWFFFTCFFFLVFRFYFLVPHQYFCLLCGYVIDQ